MDPEKSGPDSEQESGLRASLLKRKHPRKNKNSGLLLLLFFLFAGGGVAWLLMKNAAYNLAGDKRPDRATEESSVSGFGIAAGDQFSSPEEEPDVAGPSGKMALAGTFYRGAGTSGPHAGAGGGASGDAADEDPQAGAEGGSGGGSDVSGAGPGRSAALMKGSSAGKKGGPAAKAGGIAADPGGQPSVVAVQSQAPAGAGGKGGKASVLSALKSAFKTNLISARLSSQDAARTWMAKTFDGNRDSPLSLSYSERMKSKLDRVNPNSIPGYLRQQSLDATSARSLGVSKVHMPEFDRAGTQEALLADSDYQQKKMTQEIITAMFKPMGPFDVGKRNDAETAAASGLVGSRLGAQSMGGAGLSWDAPIDAPAGTSQPDVEVPAPAPKPEVMSVETPKSSVDAPVSKPKASAYQLKPEDQQTLKTDAAQELATTPSVNYGAECGCTAKAPCCCLPPGYLEAKNQNKDSAKAGVGSAAGLGIDFSGVSGSVGAAGVKTSGSLTAGGGGGSW